jgi:hypothetical protein
VVSYTTPRGNYAELWWKGADGGTPILSYLVDKNGARFLEELSQLKEEGKMPFASNEQARPTFAKLASRFYGEQAT